MTESGLVAAIFLDDEIGEFLVKENEDRYNGQVGGQMILLWKKILIEKKRCIERRIRQGMVEKWA